MPAIADTLTKPDYVRYYETVKIHLVRRLGFDSKASLREKIAALEAELEYWNNLTTADGGVPESRCEWIGRKKGDLAALHARLSQLEVPNT